MASRKKEDLHIYLRNAYDFACKTYHQMYPDDPQPFITCTYRSNEEQEQLFKLIPPVTWAHGSQSPHNYLPTFAFDIAFITIANKLAWDYKYFKKFADIILPAFIELEWGGNFVKKRKDNPHFQLRNWKKLIPKQL